MDFVEAVIRDKIKELGRLWKSSENHMNVSIDVLNSWDTLISEWAEDESMPLIIRKGNSRGQEFTHPSGRKVIISDNTFAIWVYRNVLDGKTYSLLELKNKLNNNEIPIVYALTKEDKKKATYTRTLGKDALSDANTAIKNIINYRIGCYAKHSRMVTNSPRNKKLSMAWGRKQVLQTEKLPKSECRITLFGRKNQSVCRSVVLT